MRIVKIVANSYDADMLAAVNALEQFGGGIVLVRNGQVGRSLKLEIAGLMTAADWKEVARQKIDLVETAHKEFGIADNVHPIMALSFLALAVIPELRITDKGLFDAVSFKHIPVDAKTNMWPLSHILPNVYLLQPYARRKSEAFCVNQIRT